MNTSLDCGVSTAPRAASWVATLTMLAACSGGGFAQDDTDAPPEPESDGPCGSTGAIEGGGKNKLAGVISRVGSDGLVTISNVQFTTSGARISVDGEKATVASLGVGNVVSVTGSFALTGQTGCAAAIVADADVTAVVDSVDVEQRTLTLLGQPVRIATDTVFGDGVQPAQLSTLLAGDRIRVTGLFADDESIKATRIDREPDQEGYFVAGVVSALDSQGQTFRINAMTVRYGGASLDGFATGAPRNGDNVRVTGTVLQIEGTQSAPLPSTLQPAHVEYVDYGASLSIEPSRLSISDGRTISFTVSSGPGVVSWSLSKDGGGACTELDCGVIDTRGTYTAPTGPEQKTILVTAISTSDPQVSATALVHIDPIPFPHSGLHTLTGDVFSAADGMVADAPVDIWVQQEQTGYSYWWANGEVRSDPAGHFAAPNLPDSTVSVFAVSPGYVQPCAVSVTVTQDVAVQVELVSTSTLDALNPPRPQTSAEPALTGSIYETTAAGRQSITGASLWVETALERPIATTMSDRSGAYFLCNLGQDIFIWVGRDGFIAKSIGPIDASQSGVLDIELERTPAGP